MNSSNVFVIKGFTVDKYLEFYTGIALICQNILLAIEDDLFLKKTLLNNLELNIISHQILHKKCLNNSYEA